MRFYTVVCAAASVATAAASTAAPTTTPGTTTVGTADLFEMLFADDLGLNTTKPWGTVAGNNATGNCGSDDCLGGSCFDLATTEGLDRSILSVGFPSSLAVGSSDELQAAIDADDQFDFYQTLETFACCDCEGCMRYVNCVQDLEGLPAGMSCATIWDFLLPTVTSEAEMIEALDVLNAGGCYYCAELQAALDDTVVEAVVDAIHTSFEFPDTTSTTTTTTEFTSTTTMQGEGSCADVDACGAEGEYCSCTITCARDYVNGDSVLPCCDDYADYCPEICPHDSYQVNREELTTDAINSAEDLEHYSCDEIVDLFHLSDDDNQFTCEDLERLYGLDCSGCYCADPNPAPAPAPIPVCSNENAECGFGWQDPMSCDSLIAASQQTLDTFPDSLTTHLTCAGLEDIGCNCEGCACERNPVCGGVVDGEVLCMGGETCDYWVQRLPGVTCENLEEDYGCNCNYCECDPTFDLTSTPEPECRCEMEYEMDGNMVTCDSMSMDVGGLCCGVMEYAFQMDCSGCCCEEERCETCLENTTTVEPTTTVLTTTIECPANADFYDDCSYDVTCLDEDTVIPLTNLYQRTYDCNWISSYLDNPEVCFLPPNADACAVDGDCSSGRVCRDNLCKACAPNIPGAEESSNTDEPCYYADHPNDPEYSSYDCVDDYLNNGGCIYFDQVLNNRSLAVQSYCQIQLDSVNCPNEPEDCVEPSCTPQYIPVSGCSKSCGSGQRQLEFTCFNEQDGVICDDDPDDEFDQPTNCVATGITEVGTFTFSTCNTESCGVKFCDEDLQGDGYCDWTINADYGTFFDEDLTAVNNNIDFCDWDGGDCCAYSCEHDDPLLLSWGGVRGEVCRWGGGGCQRVSAADAAEAILATDWFNPNGGLGSSPGVICTEIDTDVFDCCQDSILFDGSAESEGSCTYGTATFNDCATQGGRCLDPTAPKVVSSTTPEFASSSTTTTTTTTV